MSDHNNGRTTAMAHHAPKPRCETCPLWEYWEGDTGICHYMDSSDGDARPSAGWYCQLHPGFQAWAAQEYQRRLAAKKGGES